MAHARLGMVVAKKNVRLATARNRIKRVIRESFRQQQVQLDTMDVVVVVYPPAATLNTKELRQQVDQQWAKLISCEKV